MKRKFLFLIAAGLLGLGIAFSVAPALATSIVDFSQCSNGTGTATNCSGDWINGILNPNNSHYAEDQVVPQRWVLDITDAGSHTITFQYQARKGSVHAYDSLATWNYTQVTADRCQSVSPCPGGPLSTFPIPNDPTLVPPVGAGACCAGSLVTADHMIPAGASREVHMYGATLTGVSVPVHDSAPCPGGNCSDDYATVTVTFNVTTPGRVMMLIGGHTAASDGPRAWGSGEGAGSISGGPYHFSWTLLDGRSVGNRDNQIQSGAILTSTPTATNTPTTIPTNTPTNTPTDTPTATPTNTPTDTPTNTPTDTPTDTPTNTPTNTPTDTPTNTPTDTPTNTPTDTPTNTPTNTPTDTPTDTPTNTPTDTPTNTPTDTPTDTPTNTPTFTPTNTPTNTPTPTPSGQGCTPGFWQGGLGVTLWNQTNDPDWTAHGGLGTNPYRTTTLFNSFFTPVNSLAGKTMLELVGTGGGSSPPRKAARDVVAAYLNASFGLDYPYTPLEIKNLWADAVAHNTFDALHDLLAPLNQVGCPIH